MRGGRGTADGVGGGAIDQDALGVVHGGASRGVKADEVAGDDVVAGAGSRWMPLEKESMTRPSTVELLAAMARPSPPTAEPSRMIWSEALSALVSEFGEVPDWE